MAQYPRRQEANREGRGRYGDPWRERQARTFPNDEEDAYESDRGLRHRLDRNYGSWPEEQGYDRPNRRQSEWQGDDERWNREDFGREPYREPYRAESERNRGYRSQETLDGMPGSSNWDEQSGRFGGYGPERSERYGWGGGYGPGGTFGQTGKYGQVGARMGGGGYAEGYGQGAYGGFRGKGPKGYERSDDRLKEMICERLTEDDQVDPSDMTVDVRGGEVTLSGTVDDRMMKYRVEDMVERCGGVKEIHNNLRVNRAGRETRDFQAGKRESTMTEKVGSKAGNGT